MLVPDSLSELGLVRRTHSDRMFRITTVVDEESSQRRLGTLPSKTFVALSPRVKELVQMSLHLNFVFTRDLTKRTDRFSRKTHALYCSDDPKTAAQEVRWYLSIDAKALHKQKPIVTEYVETKSLLVFSSSGEYFDLRPYREDSRLVGEKSSYTQDLGEEVALSSDQIGLLAPSARQKPNKRNGTTGVNCVTFNRSMVRPQRIQGTVLYRCVPPFGSRRVPRVYSKIVYGP